MIVRTAYPNRRDDGSYIQFDTNSAVILNNNNEPVGTRIFGPVLDELRLVKGLKLASMASTLV